MLSPKRVELSEIHRRRRQTLMEDSSAHVSTLPDMHDGHNSAGSRRAEIACKRPPKNLKVWLMIQSTQSYLAYLDMFSLVESLYGSTYLSHDLHCLLQIPLSIDLRHIC